MFDLYVRGLASGALIVTMISVANSRIAPQTRLVTALTAVSIIAWLLTENARVWALTGHSVSLVLLAAPGAGLFWLLVRTVFDDRRLAPWDWAPAAMLLIVCVIRFILATPAYDGLWIANNLFAAALAVHAGYLILKGDAGDLVEGRRRLRGVLLGLVSVYVILEVITALGLRVGLPSAWAQLEVGEPVGGAIFCLLMLAICVLIQQARPELFGARRSPAPAAELAPAPDAGARIEAADRVLLGKLLAAMDAEVWRREGLTIGQLAEELQVSEHRLRRLINHRLGHRNFADFLNSRRIAAAQARLADPGQADRTVATIAFDLGYGSLGPFNRAFRAATGTSPTAWRQDRLNTAPDPGEAR
jgi:AraC-like DNA-binding protein